MSKSIHEIIGKVKLDRERVDFVKFKRMFHEKFRNAKWLYRGMSREEYEDLLKTRKVDSQFEGHFTLDFDMAKSWARGDDDVVVRIKKPKNATPKKYDLNSPYFDELEVNVPIGTKVVFIKKVFDRKNIDWFHSKRMKRKRKRKPIV